MSDYLRFFNQERPHQSLDHQTPDQVYYDSVSQRMAA
jgi:transposase InsO family protein